MNEPVHLDIVIGLLKDWMRLANSDADAEWLSDRLEFTYQMSLRAIHEYEPDWQPLSLTSPPKSAILESSQECDRRQTGNLPGAE